MKKNFFIAIAISATMLISLSACTKPKEPETKPTEVTTEGATTTPEGTATTPAEPSADASDILIGVAIYKFDDTFMTGIRNQLDTTIKETGAKADIVDSQNKQPTQNDQVDAFLTKGVNALAVNPVDRTAAGPIIEKAKAESIPIVFINREPEKQDLDSYDKVWYVGAKAEESGTMSGELIVDYFKANKAADKNADGKVQYVMLQGEPGHQDAVLRSEYSIKAISDAGLQVEDLSTDTAYWDKAKATDLMKNFISSKGIENIEAVLANNDDMALGAIEALKANGYNTGDASKYIPVVGVDATAPALDAMEKGELLGTVLNDAKNQGTATAKIAVAAAQGTEITEQTIGYPVTDTKYVWIPYVKVTAENMADFK